MDVQGNDEQVQETKAMNTRASCRTDFGKPIPRVSEQNQGEKVQGNIAQRLLRNGRLLYQPPA
jgi:hypothetical protein